MVGIDKEFFKKLISNPKGFPHLLLFSTKAGTGKTSLARVLIKEMKADYLMLNASDERTIDVIRNKIKRFVETKSLNSDCPKIVFLDEVDGMGGKAKDSQEALRSIMELYPSRFILTCNNINKVIEPLQSRCIKINMQLPKKESILGKIKYVCELENLEIKDNVISKLCNMYYPSIRDMLNLLYEFKIRGFKKIESKDITNARNKYIDIYDYVLQAKLLEARKEWVENDYDLRQVLKYFFEQVMKDLPPTIEKIVELICEKDYQMSVFADQDIVMTDFIMKFYNLIKE